MSDLDDELTAAVEELVGYVESLAHPKLTKPPLESRRRIAAKLNGWAPDVHAETADTLTVEVAADKLEQRLEH